MDNFIFKVPTAIYFGKGQLDRLGMVTAEYGKKALLVYGGGSIKRNGIYERVIQLLQEEGVSYLELPGVDPNPRIDTVRKGVRICKEHGIDVVLPIGGGSSIDCAKVIAAGACYDGGALGAGPGRPED